MATVVVQVKRTLTATMTGTSRKITIALVQESGAWKIDSVRSGY
jgi:hypothetical protein